MSACDGPNDPRALPLHVFETPKEWSRLGKPTTNREFAQRYGQAHARRDDGGKRWERGVPHGRDELTVVGCNLGAGMHWDVTASEPRRRS